MVPGFFYFAKNTKFSASRDVKAEVVCMTLSQKEKITALRGTGASYGVIAERLNLPLNTVKSYCRRNNLTVIAEMENANVCKVCGKEIAYIKGRKRRKFCSDICRVEWWNSHPEQVAQKAVYSFFCPHCGKTFKAYGNAHRKYCSHACYIAARFAETSGARGTDNE
jgi:endogenous inhibitor of DNA gyrase (YacG/DUF329 family)